MAFKEAVILLLSFPKILLTISLILLYPLISQLEQFRYFLISAKSVSKTPIFKSFISFKS